MINNIVTTIVNFILPIGGREIIFLVSGAIIGFLILKNFKPIQEFKRYPIEYILGSFVLYIVLSQFIVPNPVEDNSFDLLNFLSNVALAWIMTKYSVKNDFKEKQKEISAMAYKYSSNIQNKLDYSIKTCELLDAKLRTCECNNDKECKLQYNMARIQDQLLLAKKDAIQNTGNWANNISDEINKMKEVKLNLERIRGIELEIQQLDITDKKYNDNKFKLDSENKKCTKGIKEIKESMNSNVRYMLESIDELEDEQMRKIEEEIDREKMKEKFDDLGIINQIKSKMVSRKDASKAKQEESEVAN